MTTGYADTHAHLQESDFRDDVDEVIERARTAGVSTIVVPAVDLESARRGLALARGHEGVYATAGYHPHEASRLDEDTLRETERLLSEPEVVAVGEVGLDFYRMHSSVEAQKHALEAMLDLAHRHAMPVVVHCRDAWDALADQLVPWAERIAPSSDGRLLGVLHYFSGSQEDALRYTQLGFLVSVHTSVTHPRSDALREVVAAMPLDALVLETDSPYGAPQAHRGRRNEPAYVIEAARQVASLHQVSPEQVAQTTAANARRLFGLHRRVRISAAER